MAGGNVASVKQQLAALSNSGGPHKDQIQKYRAILQFILTLSGQELEESLKAFIEAIVNENVSLVISRQLLTDVSSQLVTLPDNISKSVSHYTLDKDNISVNLQIVKTLQAFKEVELVKGCLLLAVEVIHVGKVEDFHGTDGNRYLFSTRQLKDHF